jgi:hypothetical protein
MDSIEKLFAVGQLVQSGVTRDGAELAFARSVDKSESSDWAWDAEVAAATARSKFVAAAKRFGSHAQELIEIGERACIAARAAAA